MVKPRLYFDTSVFGGVYDDEFFEASNMLFEEVRLGKIVCVYSDLSKAELKNAPEKVRTFFQNLPEENMEFVQVTDEAFKLAQNYLDENVVGKTSADDCRHIATATLCKVDYLVSWNFKHIVNVYRIKGYNSVNMKNGYIQLEIRSPKDIVYGNNEEE